MTLIRVPKTPRTAFDTKRPPSELLLKQIEHLEWAALPASQRKPGLLPKGKVKTEGHAAERIHQLTKIVMAQAKAAAAATQALSPVAIPPAREPVVLPPLPGSKAKRKKASARPRAARRRSGTVRQASRRRAPRPPSRRTRKS